MSNLTCNPGKIHGVEKICVYIGRNHGITKWHLRKKTARVGWVREEISVHKQKKNVALVWLLNFLD